jgi:Rhs element Vgr protein
MPASPVVATSDLVTYAIKINGQAIDTSYQILTVTVNQQINRIPFCEIEILDGNVETEDFPISDSSSFIPGNKIEVMAGYEGATQTIFKGIIVKHSIQIKKNHGPVLTILGKDETVKMTKVRKNAYFTNQSDSDILSSLIGKYGLSADVGSTTPQQKEVIQYYATDWDFMLARADVNGMVVMVNNGKVSIQSPESLTDSVLTLTYGIDIFEFDGEVDAENQFKSIKSSAWDMKGQELTSQSQSPSNFDSGNLSTSTLSGVLDLDSFNLQTGGFLESDMLTTWAKAKAVKSAYAKMTGSVQFQGSAAVMPGELIELKGVGERFNGKGFVSGVVHELQDGNWITTVTLGISPDWFTEQLKVEAPLASGLLPGVQGLQIGIVKQINSDPDNELRVKLDLPLVGSAGDGVWARLGNMYASSGVGSFFYPEVNDEVIVGFFNDDPRFPVILGSLYSSSKTAPFTPDQENNTKGWVTRSKMKVEFQEDKKIITITTPANNQIVMSDDAKNIKLSDQNSNSITLSANGIEIKSASAITLKAATTLSVEATSGATVKVTGGDLSMQALNVSTEAQLSYKAQGNASAQMTAAGEVKIQGAIVMIN